MSLDLNELLRVVKKAAVEAVQASNPMGFCLGTVAAASPLTIRLDQKLTLTAAQLILTDAVRDRTGELTLDYQTEHAQRKAVCVHNGLRTGEKVILLRCDGGQKFIVLNRWEGA